MTIGEKIRYFRKKLNITQGQLAEKSGIHPVSIRKYETNKTIPQSPHIDKIAAALGVSSFALTGAEKNIQLTTIGNLIGLLIMLCKNDLITIVGERNEDGAITSSSASIEVNPSLLKFISLSDNEKSLDADSLICKLNDQNILNDLLKWEALYTNHLELNKLYKDSDDADKIDSLKDLESELEALEVELQGSTVSLSDS